MTKAELTAEKRPAWGCGQRDVAIGGGAGANENQGGVEILIVLLHVLGVVLHRLSFVHGVEIDLGIIVLDGLEVHSEGLLDAILGQFVGPHILHLHL